MAPTRVNMIPAYLRFTCHVPVSAVSRLGEMGLAFRRTCIPDRHRDVLIFYTAMETC
nr:hypothetical protein Q903MT_gene936 [Picea sitchensis]